jgi:hypothetical protein
MLGAVREFGFPADENSAAICSINTKYSSCVTWRAVWESREPRMYAPVPVYFIGRVLSSQISAAGRTKDLADIEELDRSSQGTGGVL